MCFAQRNCCKLKQNVAEPKAFDASLWKSFVTCMVLKRVCPVLAMAMLRTYLAGDTF